MRQLLPGLGRDRAPKYVNVHGIIHAGRRGNNAGWRRLAAGDWRLAAGM